MLAKRVFLLLTLTSCLFVPTAAFAKQTKQRAGPLTGTPTDACTFDYQRGEVARCIERTQDGQLLITQKVLKELNFDSYGLAPVLSPSRGWMYVNREGKVVVTGVAVMDNWADSFHDGLVRVVKNGKYGFADRRGGIVVPPIYDGAMNFENGTATVCKGCKSEAVGEHHVFGGGEWFQINTKGTVLARLPARH